MVVLTDLDTTVTPSEELSVALAAAHWPELSRGEHMTRLALDQCPCDRQTESAAEMGVAPVVELLEYPIHIGRNRSR